jgi:hypothetical protein
MTAVWTIAAIFGLFVLAFVVAWLLIVRHLNKGRRP